MLVCTISTASHLPKAACLAKSLSDTQPNHTMLLCLVERDKTGIDRLGSCFTDVVLASELGLPRFESLMFRYIPLEACMAMKAQILLWAFERFADEDHFLYLDSDIAAYSRFEELEFVFPRRRKTCDWDVEREGRCSTRFAPRRAREAPSRFPHRAAPPQPEEANHGEPISGSALFPPRSREIGSHSRRSGSDWQCGRRFAALRRRARWINERRGAAGSGRNRRCRARRAWHPTRCWRAD